MLQTNEYGLGWNPSEQKQTFKISIGSYDDLPDIKNGAEIDPGFSYTFHITPSVVVSSEHLEATKPEVRDCKFRHETEDMEIFKVGTR